MIKAIIKAMQVKGYAVFENDSKPFNLNYVGIRDISSVDQFNDLLILFWKRNGNWSSFTRKGTTDPGRYYLNNPLNVQGTAILKEGQMRGAFKLGKHQGKYEALVQRKPITVIRDFDKDSQLDIDSGREETGMFGINHHRANAKNESSIVGRWSAGCQVTADPHEYDAFISICKESFESHGNAITYTLLNVNDLK